MTTARLLLAGLAGLAVVGCSSAPSRFYTLDATATAGGGPAVHRAILVGPVSVPASVDRPELVVQVAPNRVDIDEFNRWAGPLGDSVARVVASNLATLLADPDVASGPLASFVPDYRVTIDVERRVLSVPEIGVEVEFPLDDFTRYRLVEGLDDIGLTLRNVDAISAYEARRASWLPRVATG